ncbi:MAG: O-antigen ligase family protein [Pseudomonadota bacterium]
MAGNSPKGVRHRYPTTHPIGARSIATRYPSARLHNAKRKAIKPQKSSAKPDFAIDRRMPLIDTFLVAIVVGAMLFNLQIGSLTPLLIIGAIGAFVVLRWERLYPLFADCWPLILLPAFVCLSAAWSSVPSTTLYYAMVYTLTVLGGLIIGGGVRARSFVVGMFIALAFYSIMSIAFGRMVNWGEGAGDAFAGLAGSKNQFGDFSGLAMIATIAAGSIFMTERRWVPAVFCAGLFPLLLVNLYLAKATSALVSSVVASGCLVLFIASRKLEIQARSGILIATLIVVAAAIATMDFWLPPLFDMFLDASGKNRGLTGRVDLWRYGRAIMADSPVLGIGYNAFWLHGNMDAEHLWKMMGISTRMGFNFHNTFMEIRVHTGWVGMAVFAAVWIYAAVRLFLRALLNPAIPLVMASALIIFFSMKLQFEVIGFETMHFSTIIGFAALAMGLRSTGKAKAPLPQRR